MPGRKRAAVTKLFKDLENFDIKVPRVQCLFCQSSVIKNGTRLKAYIKQCLSCPKLFKQKFVDKSCKIINKSDGEESVENWLVDFSSKTLKKNKLTISNFADKITTQEQKKYDTLLAQAIYASASPISMVENPHWKSFLTQLDRLTLCQVRTRYQSLCLTLLLLEVETVATIAASDLVGLMCDGWSNIRNELIINFVVSQPKLIFWKSFHTDLQSHTGEYIATKILKVIEELRK